MAGGIVYLVGAGPGAPDLITVKGLDCIRRADVLVYDRLASPALVAQARPDAELVYVGKETGHHGRKQSDINRLLAERALQGKVVCRLKGGDPFVFGRGGEEADLLVDLGVPFEVVPGITAGLAATAYAGIPVTHRDVAGSVALVTGHEAPCKRGPAVDWARLATGTETLLIYMGVESLPQTAERLIVHGRSPETPVAVIRWGSRSEQRTVTGTLATIAEQVRAAAITSPAMIVVGEVAALRNRLHWAESRPRFGERVLVPVLEPCDLEISHVFRQAGAEVWEWPLADPADPEAYTELDGAIARLPDYDAIHFTCATGVRRFLRRVVAVGRDVHHLLHLRVTAVDNRVTEALSEAGIRTSQSRHGLKTLLVGAEEVIDGAAEELRATGALVDTAATHRYRLRSGAAAQLLDALAKGDIQEVLFRSPITASLLVHALGGPAALGGVRISFADWFTAEAALRAGLGAERVPAHLPMP